MAAKLASQKINEGTCGSDSPSNRSSEGHSASTREKFKLVATLKVRKPRWRDLHQRSDMSDPNVDNLASGSTAANNRVPSQVCSPDFSVLAKGQAGPKIEAQTNGDRKKYQNRKNIAKYTEQSSFCFFVVRLGFK